MIVEADEPEFFELDQEDLHGNNIFVEDGLELSGITDWECLLTVPL
jgi:hypothetical protein